MRGEPYVKGGMAHTLDVFAGDIPVCSARRAAVFVFVLGSFALLGLSRSLLAQPGDLAPVRIGVVQDGAWDRLDGIIEAVERELVLLVGDEFDVSFPEAAHVDGAWDLERIRSGFERLLADDSVDQVIALGPVSSQLAAMDDRGYEKPVIAPIVLDVVIQGLPRAGEGSGVPNLTYVALPYTLHDELDRLLDVVPFRKVGLVVNGEVLEALPEIADRSRELTAELGLELSWVPARRTAASVLENLPADIDVVYFWPILLEAGEMAQLIEGLNERSMPSFSSIGRSEVEAGMLAALASEEAFDRIARRVALNIQRILLGDEPAEIPVTFRQPQELVLNLATARRIGVSPRWETLLEAETLYAEDTDREVLELNAAVERALLANLDLAVKRAEVAAGREEVSIARSSLLPQLEASALGLQIDSDRAEASFGAQPERTLTGSLGLSQLLYSDGAWGNLAIQRSLQQLREAELNQLRLDIALEAATAYINLLRARNLLRVQRENVELTRSNLDLARTRRDVGTAAAGEVLRWESQIASDRRQLVEAAATVEAAEIALNRLLHYDLERSWQTREVDYEDPEISPDAEPVRGFIETPAHFAVLRDFMVELGVSSSFELQQVDASIAAQERLLLVSERQHWLPQIAAQGALDEVLERGGIGSDLAANAEDTSWSVGVSLSLPLLRGGAIKAERVQARLELERLNALREATAERVAEAIRSAVIATRSSSAEVGLARESARAARENFELVQEAYAQGTLTILDVLDAQNAAFGAELGAADSVHDFFVDLMRLQRAASQLELFLEPGAQQRWVADVDAYFRSRGVVPWRDPRSRESGR